MLTNRTELEICLWDRDASAFYALLEYSVVSRVMRKIDYGSGRNLLQGAA